MTRATSVPSSTPCCPTRVPRSSSCARDVEGWGVAANGAWARAVYPLPPHLRRDDGSSTSTYGYGQVERSAALDSIIDFVRTRFSEGFVGMKVDGYTIEVYRGPRVGRDLDRAVRREIPRRLREIRRLGTRRGDARGSA